MQRWTEMYQQKVKTAQEAVKLIENGDRIVAPLGNGAPRLIGSALASMIATGDYQDLRYLCGLNLNAPGLTKPDVTGRFHYEDGYLTPFARPVIAEPIGEYQPMKLSDLPRTIGMERDFNVVVLTVAPMDQHGFFSTGVFPDYGFAIAMQDRPKKIIVEVNDKYPKTYGYNHIHISDVDAVVEASWGLVALPPEKPNEKDRIIAEYIAEQIPDGACLQLGIGGMPNAVGQLLENKRDLAVHSEMICDAMMDLYYKGVITSKKKTFMPGKWVATFVLGTQALYDFVAENPMIEMHPTDFVNNPRIACQNDKLMSINTIMEVDLGGQCISESIGFSPYSGLGGQEDFLQASWYSNGGKGFLATYSTYTDKDGQLHSKIVPTVNGFVSISRWNTQYVVSEYGIAYLKGKTMKDRVKEMINIAHPDFRDWLLSEAKRLKFV